VLSVAPPDGDVSRRCLAGLLSPTGSSNNTANLYPRVRKLVAGKESLEVGSGRVSENFARGSMNCRGK